MDIEHLSKIDRIRIPESRDFVNGFLMNRNERVVPWPKEVIDEVMKTIHPNEWNMYHYVQSLYKKWANYADIDEDEICIINGAEDGIMRCYQMFVKEGTHVGYLFPTYAMYYVYTDAFKGVHHRYEYDVNKHDLKLQKQKILDDLPNLDLLTLANPNHFLDNLTQEDIEEICTKAKENNVIVVIDEVAGGFGVYRAKNLINKYDNLIVINSFSKEFGLPTIRTGALMGCKKLMKAARTLRLSYEISMFSQKFAEYILDNIHLKEDYCQQVVEGREYCIEELKKIGVECNSDNAVYFNPYFENIKQKNYVIQKLQDVDKIYVKNYKHKMYNGKFEHFITVAGAPKKVMEHFVARFKKHYFDFDESMEVPEAQGPQVLYCEPKNK
jgi:histidinol-phosphate aminotransferase